MQAREVVALTGVCLAVGLAIYLICWIVIDTIEDLRWWRDR